eukprot:TRINITY_DN92098_c0_g1_i1.p1 TRINITY_DN92098_c0_g1~~TRINITY_DN92098_c0_g1_i1.p1  ORF type:complete len:729 (+),score=111.71 TRINITY_DN92098_c0_g1_i1:67-2253(+)
MTAARHLITAGGSSATSVDPSHKLTGQSSARLCPVLHAVSPAEILTSPAPCKRSAHAQRRRVAAPRVACRTWRPTGLPLALGCLLLLRIASLRDSDVRPAAESDERTRAAGRIDSQLAFADVAAAAARLSSAWQVSCGGPLGGKSASARPAYGHIFSDPAVRLSSIVCLSEPTRSSSGALPNRAGGSTVIAQTVGSYLSSAASSVAGAVQSAAGSVAGAVQSIPGSASHAASTIGGAVQSIPGNVGGAVQAFPGAAAGAVQSLPGLATRFVESTATNARNLGDNAKFHLSNGVSSVGQASQNTWQRVLRSEGQFVYNLFKSQLALFVPGFDPASQIEGDFFMHRSIWLRNLSVSPVAATTLLPLAPPGLNFTEFFISDVQVSWDNLLDLERRPIVVDIDRVRATAAEKPSGSHEEVNQLIENWLKIYKQETAPFDGKYPLLDGATFRIRRIELNISSSLRYGNLAVVLNGVEAQAVDGQGNVQDLRSLCKDGLKGDMVTFCRRIESSQAFVRYRNTGLEALQESAESPDAYPFVRQRFDDRTFESVLENTKYWGMSPVLEKLKDVLVPDDDDRDEEYLLQPTPVSAQLTQTKVVADARRIVGQRWRLVFPGQTSILTLPPLLGPASEPPPPDPRLCPFEAPTPEWQLVFASRDPFDWVFSSWRMQGRSDRPLKRVTALKVLTVIAVTAGIFIFVAEPRPWLRTLWQSPMASVKEFTGQLGRFWISHRM